MQVILSDNQLREITGNFVQELEEAASGKKNSIAFIRNPYRLHKTYKSPMQVMSFGGSTFLHADVQRSGADISLTNNISDALPLLERDEVVYDLFLKTLSPAAVSVGISFAYPQTPVERNGRLDGTLYKATKEHRFTGLIGKTLGKELERIAGEKGRTIEVAVANDTVCLILALLPHHDPLEIVGGILGTGTNYGFFLDANTIINLESGNFDKFPHSEALKTIDAKTVDAGQQLYEKEVAGQYLYLHYNFLKQKEATKNSEELSRLASEGDELAQQVIERSASMTACQLTAIHSFKKTPITIIMEGSLFWKGFNYKDYVEKYLEILSVSKQNYSFTHKNSSSLIGASYL